MATGGQTDTAGLVAMLSERAAVNVRLALVADAQQWQLHHGQVTLDDDIPLTERAWRYSTATFLGPVPSTDHQVGWRLRSQMIAPRK
ncbi:hypothetical protein [Streptomyces sp. NPDC002550]